jgi:pyridoxine 5-phosphate synthase
MTHLDFSVTVDHVATLRNARGGTFPCPVEAARIAVAAGADGVTMHLREDRRHIRDGDVERVRAEIAAPLNFEMAATGELVAIAERIRPPYCCLVPEKRQELTTEGGLDVLRAWPFLREAIERLIAAGVRVSIFIEADPAQIEAAARWVKVHAQLHTGTYAEGAVENRAAQLARLKRGAEVAKAAGLLCHAGHGLSYDTVGPIAAWPEVTEISIGHFLISQSLFEGLEATVRRFRAIMDAARNA